MATLLDHLAESGLAVVTDTGCDYRIVSATPGTYVVLLMDHSGNQKAFTTTVKNAEELEKEWDKYLRENRLPFDKVHKVFFEPARKTHNRKEETL